MRSENSKVYIIILNWNGWEDTIECLESVFRNSYPNYKVIVCDNASTDNSLEKIKQWANGHRQSPITRNMRIAKCTTPPIAKPIPYVEYTYLQVEKIEGNDVEPPLILIQTGDNLGYAGGNNVGVRYALKRNNCEYLWFLNNDTVIDPAALAFLIKRMQDKPKAGICGSTLLYYDKPDKIQALGGAQYNKWLGIANHLGVSDSFNSISINSDLIERKMSYIVGASMLVSKQFVLDIGLMSESYFLYYEEVDWAIRGKDKYELAYARQSIVYHKEGGTIGSSNDPKKRSFKSDYFTIKNRIIFTSKYFKYALLTVYLGLIPTIFNRIRRKQWDRVWMILKVAFKR